MVKTQQLDAVCSLQLDRYSQDRFQWSLNGITHSCSSSFSHHLRGHMVPGIKVWELNRDSSRSALDSVTGPRISGVFIMSMSSFLEHYVQVSWISWTDMNWTNDILYKRTNEYRWSKDNEESVLVQALHCVHESKAQSTSPEHGKCSLHDSWRNDFIDGRIGWQASHRTHAQQNMVVWPLPWIGPQQECHTRWPANPVCATKNDWLTQCLLPFSCGIVWFCMIHINSWYFQAAGTQGHQ